MIDLVSILQSWVDAMGVQFIITDLHTYIILGVSSLLFFSSLALILRSSSSSDVKEIETVEVIEVPSEEKTEEVKEETESSPVEVEFVEVPVEAPVVKKGPTWSDRLRKGLSHSNTEVWGKIGNIFSSGKIDEDALEEIEEILYGADLGPTIATELIEELQQRSKSGDFGPDQFKSFLKSFLKDKMKDVQTKTDPSLYDFKTDENSGTKVIMIVGVNGAGKTTTIGKLSTKLTGQGAKVVVGACDTFRAAAVDQLQVWCDRAGATMIRAKEGANPSGVGYDALKEAMNQKADYCILDTAGRLHTASNLMDELTKSKNVLKKLDESAPHHVLLVIDAITGQNALRQAEEFNKTLDLTGLIFTKCDGSSKAGSAVGIVKSLNVPITYIGVGENVEDLNVFDLDEYLDALIEG